MAKEDFILAEGVIAESLPNVTFRVEVAGQPDLLLCHLSGKMRKHKIRVLPGDRVIFEMSPYDLTKGRIIRRLKPDEPGLAQQQAAAEAQLEESQAQANPENTESNEATESVSPSEES